MYDSDEVRDAARRDAAEFYMRMTQAALKLAATPLLSPLDNAALDDALAAEGNPWQRAILDYLRTSERQPERKRLERVAAIVLAAVKAWAEEVVGAFRPLVERLNEFYRLLAEPFSWRRGCKPEVQPAQPVDAVAAGRHPAVTQLRGGRR